MEEIAKVIERVVAWMLRAGDQGEISERVARRDSVRKIVDAAWLELLSPYDRKRAETRMRRFKKAGIGEELAMDVALLRSRASSFDVISLAEATGLEPKRAAELFYRVGARFKIDRIRAALITQEPDSHWDALALRHIQEEMFAAQADFAGQVAKYWLSEDPRSAIEDWIRAELGGIKPFESTVQMLISEKNWTVAKFSIISNLLQGLRERKKNAT
jgi:glutamate dehydrogenase